MKKIIAIVFIFYGSAISAKDAVSSTKLTKIFCHKGTLGDKIVCYFDKEPICNFLPERAGAPIKEQDNATFFLPKAELGSPEVRKALAALNSDNARRYNVSIAQVDNPIKGIKIVITFDPQIFRCECETFNAITQEKGIVFALYDKKMLQDLHSKTDSLVRYAYNDSSSKKKRIVVDYGHGGQDPGKVGCFGVQEKDITRQVGVKLAALLKKKGYEVLLTRKADYFVALDERTSFANRHRADLFVSLHANSCPKSDVSGIETYYTSSDLFKPIHATALDNTVDYLKGIRGNRDKASNKLAACIHSSTLSLAAGKNTIYDRKVKKSVGQVLMGTQMPAALIEMGFLSNEEETLLLQDSSYQTLLAQGIAAGIDKYYREMA